MHKCGLLLATSLFVCSQAFAAMPAFVETYDVPTTPCEGLILDGVAYAFTVAGAPSLDCGAGTGIGPGITNDINAPNIEGNSAGVLHLTFDHPTTEVDFGIAQDIFSPPNNSVTINLYRPGVGLLRQELSLTTTNDPDFLGGHFTYRGPAVKSVTIQFPGDFSRFALDNLSYFRPPGQQ